MAREWFDGADDRARVNPGGGSAAAAQILYACKLATTANHGLSGTASIDGQSVSSGDRILVWKQSTGSQNGIYYAASGAWSKIIADFLPSYHIVVSVALGTLYGQTFFVSTSQYVVSGMGAYYK